MPPDSAIPENIQSLLDRADLSLLRLFVDIRLGQS